MLSIDNDDDDVVVVVDSLIKNAEPGPTDDEDFCICFLMKRQRRIIWLCRTGKKEIF